MALLHLFSTGVEMAFVWSTAAIVCDCENDVRNTFERKRNASE